MMKKLIKLLNGISGLGCLTIATLLVLEFGFQLSNGNAALFTKIHMGIMTYFTVDVGLRLLGKGRLGYFLTHPTDLVVAYPFIQPYLPEFFVISGFMQETILILLLLGRLTHIQAFLHYFQFRPTQMLSLGFVMAIFIGSLVLSLPIAVVDEQPLLYLDALFTAASAICVTGLVTVDISSTFTRFGQAVILVLIQVGGIGIMAFSALLAQFFQKKLSSHETKVVQQSYAAMNVKDMAGIVRAIFKYTLILEAIGAVLLFFAWYSDFDNTADRVFNAVFHSVSAFCNAGFSLFSTSLMEYAAHVPTLLIISILIILGGIGFPVLYNLARYEHPKFRLNRLRLQTQIVLLMTVMLITVGTIAIYVSESGHALAGYSISEKLWISYFQSVSARTAGFNTVDLATFSPASLIFIISLMFIGASPGSTGGGIKTTTFAILVLTLFANLKSKAYVTIYGRTISNKDIFRALSVIIISVIVIFTFLYAMLLIENKSFLGLVFEVVSAFGTVGLSLGVTPELNKLGKLVIILLMFVGRVGPMTVAFALSRKPNEIKYKYPEEKILIM